MSPQWLMNLVGMDNARTVESTELVANVIYNRAFSFNQFAEGQAMAVTFFVILAIFSIGQVYFNKKREVEL